MYKYLSELQDTHLELMNEYVNLLSEISLLPFFIDTSSIKHKGQRKNKLFNTFIGKVLFLFSRPIIYLTKFITWRPIVSYFVEDHIRTKLLEISKIYLQLAQNLDPKLPKEKAKIEWLLNTSKSSEAFANSLFSWGKLQGNILWIANLIISLILAYYGKDFLIQLLFQSLNNLLQFFILIVSFLILFATYSFFINLAIILSFEAKRTLFAPNIEDKYFLSPENEKIINTYKTEDNLFRLVERKKKLEYPLDIALPLFFYSVLPMLLFLLALTVVLLQKQPSLVEVVISYFVSAIPFIVFAFPHVQEWKNREWR